MNVALLYNLRADFPSAGRRATDSDVDWDDPSTVEHLADGLRAAGHEVLDLGDPLRLVGANVRAEVDLAFNICEMCGLRFREALAPALCELLGVPYAFSPPDVMVATLDKNLANLLVRQAGVHVPDWRVVSDPDDLPAGWLHELLLAGPAIVKPLAEGGSMGISAAAITATPAEVAARVRHVVATYRQPAMVQRLAAGREVTVAVVEVDSGPHALAPMEVVDRAGFPPPVYGYEQKEVPEMLAVLRPLQDAELARHARAMALEIFVALGCRDAARVDLRVDAIAGRLAFLEANPLPHLHPTIGDFGKSAAAAGWSYPRLIGAIVDSAVRRRAGIGR